MADNTPLTHADLVALAAVWLRNARGCPVVVTELVAHGASEVPDAIGWLRPGWSIVVECKTSRADLRADRRKNKRRNHRGGLGFQRYYLTPPGLIDHNEVPDGWGLVECRPHGITTVVDAPGRHSDAHDWRGETAILLSALRRLGVRSDGGVSIKVYTIQTQCRSGIYLQPEEEATSA